MKTPLKQNELDLSKEQIDSMSQEDWDNLPIVTGPKPKKKKQPWEVMDAHNIHAAKTNDPIGGGDPSISDTIKLSDEDLTSTKNISPNYRDDLPKLSAHRVPSWMKVANVMMPTYARIAKKIFMPDSSSPRSYEYDHEKQVDLDEAKDTISQRPIDQWRKAKTKALNKIKRVTGFKQQEDAATAADSTFVRRHHPVFTTTFHAGASEEIKNLQDAGINLWPGWKEDIIQTHKIKGEKAVKLAKKKNIDVPAWKQELDKGEKN